MNIFIIKSSVVFEMSLKTLLLVIILVNKSFELSLECYFVDYIWDLGPLYTCKPLKIWDFDEPNIKLINGTESHYDDRNNSDVRAIHFDEDTIEGNDMKSMTKIPENFHEFFPEIEIISFNGKNKIQYISSSNLQNYKELRSFIIYWSKIKSIPSDFFQYSTLR